MDITSRRVTFDDGERITRESRNRVKNELGITVSIGVANNKIISKLGSDMAAEGTSVSFKYDHNGLRTRKIVEQDWYPVTTDYTMHGKLITHMNVHYTDFNEVEHDDSLHFFYDAQSRPAKVNFNDMLYTYVHNLQGDIVGIIDGSGVLVVEYKYDAWGKKLAATGSLAATLGVRNPFRYRGYVYDEETGLYYLVSRYYNPAWIRFSNADALSDIAAEKAIANTYSYCFNNPITLTDETGRWPSWSSIFAVVAIVAAVVAVGALVVATAGMAVAPLATAAGYVATTTTATIATTSMAVAQTAGYIAVVATSATAVTYAYEKSKPVNLPASKRLTLNMGHILSGHGGNGNRGGGNKDRFPKWMTPAVIERAIRYAYEHGSKIQTQADRYLVRGTWQGKVIEMWVNFKEFVIETAYPKGW